jgi:hypothetical protein
MQMRKSMLQTWMLILSTALAACQSTPTPKAVKLTVIPGGTLSAMDASNTNLRAQLPASPIPLVRDPVYAPMGACTYWQVYTAPGTAPAQTFLNMVSKRVRDRLLITMREDGEDSTVLIGRNGRIYDFNLRDIASRSRFTSETYRSMANAQKDSLRSAHGPTLEIINQVSAVFPEYFPGRRNVGDVVALVTTTDGKPWGSYYLRGVGTYKGRGVAILDLVRTLESHPELGPVTVGFSVTELSTMMPVLFVLDAGWKVHLERSSCP